MSNPFDQFDAVQSPAPKNPFDQFDAQPKSEDTYIQEMRKRTGENEYDSPPAKIEPEKNDGRTWREFAGDMGAGLGKTFNTVASSLAQNTDAFITLSNKTDPAKIALRAVAPELAKKTDEAQKGFFGAVDEQLASGEEFWQGMKSGFAQSGQNEVAAADGAKATADVLLKKPELIFDYVADSSGFMVPSMWVVRGLSAANASAKAVGAATAGTGALLDSGSVAVQTKREAMSKTPEQLMVGSPEYIELTKPKELGGGGLSHDDAKERLAREAGFTAQAMQLPLSFLASRVLKTGELESNFFTGKGVGGLFSAMLREGGEEVAQEGGGQFNTNAAIKNTVDENRDLTKDVAKSALLGGVLGAGQGGGMKAVGSAANIFRPNEPSQNDFDGGIDTPIGGIRATQSAAAKAESEAALRKQEQAESEAALQEQAASLHPAYARVNSTHDDIEASLSEPVDVDAELNALLSDTDNYRAERLRQTAQPAMERQFQPPVQTGVNPFDQFDNVQPSGLFDGIRATQSAAAKAESEAALRKQEQADNEAFIKRHRLMNANFQEDDEGGLFSGVRTMVDQSRYEPIKNTIDPADTAEMYPADPAANRAVSQSEARVSAPLPENLSDQRLARPEYRTRLERMAQELVKGGGVGYVRDEHDRITGRTPSLNADWFKAMNENPETKSSVAHSQAAIEKALKGEKLGAREKRVVAAAMDAIGGERGSYGRELLSSRAKAKADRQAAFESWKKATDVPPDADFASIVNPVTPSETYTESDYLPHAESESRAISELADHATEMGASWKDIDNALELGDINQQTEALTKLIWNKRNEHRAGQQRASTQGEPGARSGAVAGMAEEAPNIENGRGASGAGREGSQIGGRGNSVGGSEQPESVSSIGFSASPESSPSNQSEDKLDMVPTQMSGASVADNQETIKKENQEPALVSADSLEKNQEPIKKIDSNNTDIQGNDIDGDWAEFSGKSGTKKIPRANMPQIKAEHRGAMVNFLNARGVTHQEETVSAGNLKPTQAEFSREKVAKAKRFEGGNRSILVSSDNHVLDGHHQWLASRAKGEDVKIIRLNAPINQLVDLAHEFPSSTTNNESQQEAKEPRPSDGVSVSGDAISSEDADLLRAELKRLSRTTDFETDGSRQAAYLKRIQKAVDGDVESVAWASDWLSEVKQKNADKKTKSLAEEADKSQQTEDKNTAIRDEQEKNTAAFYRGEIPDGTQPKYAEWVASLTDGARQKLFAPDASGAARNVEYMAWAAKGNGKIYQRPESEVSYQLELPERLDNGEVTIGEFKSAFDSLVSGRETVIAELSKLTKDKLLAMLNPFSAARVKSEKKDYIVRNAYEEFIKRFYYTGSNSGMMSIKGNSRDFIQNYIDTTRPVVEAATQENLDQHASDVAAARAERDESKKRKQEGIQEPKTLEDFRNLHRSILSENENMTQAEARMQMTSVQRAEYDRLSAIDTRTKRVGEKSARKSSVESGDQLVGGTIIETKHTKKGHDLFVVQLEARVSRDDYGTLASSAKKLGGYYSSFRGAGAVPGFQFTTSDDAKAFLDLAGGNAEAASKIAKEKRDAFEDDKSQSTAERLRTMAAAMSEHAEHELGRDRKSNTSRRAGMAARALESAEREKAMAETMGAIADGIENGDLTFLDKLRTKAQLGQIQAALHVAKGDEIRSKYNSYAEQLKHEGEPITAETVDHAAWPYYVAYRSDLAKLARQMIETDGLKKLGSDLLKVADDTSAEYLAFAKENLHKVSTFQNKAGALAVFKTKKDAALSIDGSGFSGKAIPFEVKRGENLIILSPSEAAARGIWNGSDKKITLNPEFVEKLIEQAARKNRKKEKVSVPWQLETAYEKRQRYKAMGIETAAEFRAALREYVGIAKQPSAIDKVKKLELAMVGRKKDGLDFFPTPQSVADEMINTAGIQAGMSVLEPSAGMGHIADRIRAFGVEPDVVEVSSERRELLEAKGYNLVGMDFTEYKNRDTFGYGDTFKAEDGSVGILRGQGGLGSDRVRLVDESGEGVGKKFFSMSELTPVKKNGSGSGYDRIIMNPPFSDRRDMEHVLHAYDLLKPGGRIVAIVGEGVMFGSDKKATEFRDWLDKLGATAEKLEEGTFNDPSLPVTTGVNARMLVIDKPQHGAPDISYSLNDGDTSTTSAPSGITKSSAQSIIDSITSGWKNPYLKVSAFDSLGDLPENIQRQIKTDGKSANDIRALIQGGKVFINAAKMKNSADIERAIFHEIDGHHGLDVLFGGDIGKALNKLYLSVGGRAGLGRIAQAHGIDLSKYEALGSARGYSAVQVSQLMTNELLAHIAQDSKPSVKRFFSELIGAIRSWLRSNGFSFLGNMNDAELTHLLKQSREAARNLDTGAVKSSVVRYLLGEQSSQNGNPEGSFQNGNNHYSIDGLPPKTRKIIGSDPLLAAWSLLAQHDGAFKLPVSNQKSLEGIFSELEGERGFTIERDDTIAKTSTFKARKGWLIRIPVSEAQQQRMRAAGEHPTKYRRAVVLQNARSVWIDISDGITGADGKRVYNAVANYAYNNDLVFIGDPAGLSDEALSRRLENMFSSALKFGTTKHLWPHERQVLGDKIVGVPGLKWKDGDDAHNLKELITTSYEATKNQFPEIEGLYYNPLKDRFEDAQDGTEYTANDFKLLAKGKRGESGSDSLQQRPGAGSGMGATITAGRTSIERAVLTHTLLRGTSSQKSELLAKLSHELPERLSGDENAILYSLEDDQNETRSQGGFSVSGIGKKIPIIRDGIIRREQAATLPPELRESFLRSGQNKSITEKILTEVKRQLTPAGLLPKEVFDLKVTRDGELNANEMHTRHTLRGFYDAIEKAYGMEYKKLKGGTKREINKVLRGEPSAQLAPSLIAALNVMRDDIKRLSAVHVRQLAADAAELREQGKDAEADSKMALLETISENFDTYLHRSYRAFDDKKWPEKVPPQVYADAVNFIASEYAEGGAVTPAIREKAVKRVHMILHEGTAFDSMGAFISQSKLGAKDLSIMKKRKDVPAPIRALLGEYEDAALNYVKSVTKMSHLVHNHAFLTSMKQAAFDLGLLHDKENVELEATKKIAADGSEAYAPLNGLYTTREFEQALKDALGKTNPNAIYDAIVAANGMVKFGKTVLSPTTAMRNFMSSAFFTMSNGHFDWKQMSKSVDTLQVYFQDRGDSAVKEYLIKLRKIGVIYDSPYASEMMDLLKDSRLSEVLNNGGTPLLDGSKKAIDFAQKFYSMGDDFYKIVGYENEKALLMKHRGMSEEAAEKAAAERIRNTYPTYSMIGKGVNTLRRFPVVGTFVSFPAEIIRTSYHITNYLVQDAKQYGLKDKLVQRRLIGYALATGMIAGLSVLSAALFGVDDDEEKALRLMSPDWTKNSNILWLWRDDDGNRRYLDLTFLDPYAYWKKPIMAAINGESVGSAAAEASREILAPFLSLDIAFKAITEASLNKKFGGGTIYNELDSSGSIAGEIGDHIRKALQPGIASNIERFVLAAKGDYSKTGKPYKFDEESWALVGFRVGTFDPKAALYYQAMGYQDEKAQAAKLLSSVATNVNEVDDDELQDAFKQSLVARKNAYDKMQTIVDAARSVGLDKPQLISALRNSGVSIKDAMALANNREPIFTSSKTTMKGAIKKAAVLFNEETQLEFKRREKAINDLRRQAVSHQSEFVEDD